MNEVSDRKPTPEELARAKRLCARHGIDRRYARNMADLIREAAATRSGPAS